MKRCPSCGATKPLTAFYIDRSKAGGLRSACKRCDLEKSRRYYAANRERKLAKANARNARLRREWGPSRWTSSGPLQAEFGALD